MFSKMFSHVQSWVLSWTFVRYHYLSNDCSLADDQAPLHRRRGHCTMARTIQDDLNRHLTVTFHDIRQYKDQADWQWFSMTVHSKSCTSYSLCCQTCEFRSYPEQYVECACIGLHILHLDAQFMTIVTKCALTWHQIVCYGQSIGSVPSATRHRSLEASVCIVPMSRDTYLSVSLWMFFASWI